MKRTLLISIFAMISLQTLYAVSDFRPGYVIVNSGDTLHGLIDQKGKRSRPHRCIFKENPQAPEQVFLPKDALAYHFTDGKYYTSRIITIDGENIPLFLEHLFNGIVDVFYFRGLAGDNYLIESNDTIYQLKIVKRSS
jgi:hypothetical protein